MRLRDRSGFTLFEVLTVIVLVGILLAWAFPRISTMAKSASLRTSRGAMVTAVNVSKTSAVTSGKCGYLRLAGNAVTVFTTPCEGGSQITVVSNRNFETDYGVGVTMRRGSGSELDTDSLGFDPRGIPLNTGQTVTFTMTNPGGSKTLTVGKYGMMQ